MSKQIPIEALGRAYGVAIERMYEVIANYSEDLYTSDGNPKEDPGEVSRVLDSMISKLRHEASLIKRHILRILGSQCKARAGGVILTPLAEWQR